MVTLVDNDPQLLTAASQITGVVAAGLADGDVQQGAEIAGNATTYNYLQHAQFQDIADRLEQCTTQSCRDNIIDKALALSQQQDLAALQLCASGSTGCGDAVLASMTTPFEGVEFSKPETAASLRELMWENPGKNGAFAMAAANQDAATVVDALDPEDRLSPEQRAQAEETLAGVMSSGGIGADRGGYTGGRGVTKPLSGAPGSGEKGESGGLDGAITSGTKGGPSVKHASGVELPKSQSQMIANFETAGYPSKPVVSPTSGKVVGTQYTLPDGSRVRVMQADSRNSQRASFENANGGPIDPTTGKPPQPPKGLSKAERKQWIREKTHIEQVS
ncbi:VENN motif pre-toxin domain-containing protein [Salinicola socius]|uniref:VENN motif pre-toxin domain-containing protein n=1 Tax=Salinicola socius TaxID=404433 RepID=UPI00244851AB|nr:VENN motif pre-toxin domain-containing protein [Salinicola socius]